MKRHYLILIMLSLVGCDSSSQEVSTYEEGESRPVREASPENQNDDSEQYNELGLDDIYNGFANKTAAETLNYFCDKAGGDFDPINYNCVCPEGKTYLGFKYAACVKYNEITAPAEVFGERVTVISMKLDAHNGPLFDETFSANDKLPRAFSFRASGYPYIKFKNIENRTLTVKDLEFTFGADFLPIQSVGLSLDTFPIVLGESQNYGHYTNEPLKEGAWETLNQNVKNINLEKFGNETLETKSSFKCMYNCTITKRSRQEGFSLKWTKEYHGGVLLRNYITVENSSYFKTHIMMDAFNKATYVAHIKLESKDDSILKKYLVETASGQTRNYKMIILSDTQEELYLSESIKGMSSSHASAVLCDAPVRLKGAQDRGLLDKIYISERFGKNSLMGTMSANDDIDIFREVLSLNDNLSSYVFGSYEHAYSMMGFMPEYSVTPISLTNCVEDDKVWKGIYEDQKYKVVNLSANDTIDPKMCEVAKFSNRVQEGLDNGLMWIMSAGNSDVRLNSPKDYGNCPQNTMSGKEGVLVVSANYNTVKGDNLVDIFVKDENGRRLETTSEATAALTSFVLSLYEEYPNAKREDIKRAILLSSEVERGYAKNSRAGGFLDRENAKNIMALIYWHPDITDKELIKEVFGTFYGCYGKCKDKLNHMNL